jgi:hypothetical protein
MSYSDFDLRAAQERFGLTLVEGNDLFSEVAEVEPGDGLRQTLEVWAPAALAMNTEKARSEMIIAPILMEVVRLSDQRINLFSGIAFDVDRERGLNGTCDFLVARSRELFYLRQPVVAVVEAKKEDIVAGLGQCVAALVAAQIFNARSEESPNGPVHGAVTTGNTWRFLRLDGNTVSIDRPEYYFDRVGKILGILLSVST